MRPQGATNFPSSAPLVRGCLRSRSLIRLGPFLVESGAFRRRSKPSQGRFRREPGVQFKLFVVSHFVPPQARVVTFLPFKLIIESSPGAAVISVLLRF